MFQSNFERDRYRSFPFLFINYFPSANKRSNVGNGIRHPGTEPARHLAGLTGMKFKLKALHRYGIVLTPEELAYSPRYVGNLVVEDWEQDGVFAGHARQARLLDMDVSQLPRDVIPPLFDPQLVRMLDSQIVLHGYQIHVDAQTGAARHYAQVWTLRPTTDE
jgi:hypothetical protein